MNPKAMKAKLTGDEKCASSDEYDSSMKASHKKHSDHVAAHEKALTMDSDGDYDEDNYKGEHK